VELDRKRDAEKLLKQEVVFDPVRSVLIVFRRPSMTPTNERVFEVTNVKYQQDLVDLELALVKEGAQVTLQSPTTNEWTSTYSGRVIWKMAAPTLSWKVPTKATSTLKTTMQIRPAPTCTICHSDDHHNLFCEWRAHYPEVKFQRKPARTN
jgi:hypothetical protein